MFNIWWPVVAEPDSASMIQLLTTYYPPSDLRRLNLQISFEWSLAILTSVATQLCSYWLKMQWCECTAVTVQISPNCGGWSWKCSLQEFTSLMKGQLGSRDMDDEIKATFAVFQSDVVDIKLLQLMAKVCTSSLRCIVFLPKITSSYSCYLKFLLCHIKILWYYSHFSSQVQTCCLVH